MYEKYARVCMKNMHVCAGMHVYTLYVHVCAPFLPFQGKISCICAYVCVHACLSGCIRVISSFITEMYV